MMSDGLDRSLAEKILAPTVRELHVDFLLEEEFCANPEFLRTFVKTVKPEHTPQTIVEVKHSSSDQYGEADLLVVYNIEGGRKIGLLIEDKIRAAFQPNQAERYHERGAAGIREKSWDEYWTCLVAPKIYIKDGHGFDATAHLEQIKDWLAIDEPGRHQFKAKIIERAIKKAETSGVQVIDVAMTKFRRSYYDFLLDFFRNAPVKVKMAVPADSWKGESWFYLRSDLLPKGVYVHHKSDRGFIDLTFPDTDAERLIELQKYLEPDMRVAQTNKSIAIRVLVPRIERFDDFEVEKEKVHKALIEVTRLLVCYERERTQMEGILSRARRVRRGSKEESANA